MKIGNYNIQNNASTAPVIVRSTSRKVTDAVYAARQKLKTRSDRVFIKEDLIKPVADLFREAT
jgi:hypothetical protein